MREGYFALTAKTGIINLSDKNNARLLKHYIEEDININLHEQRGDNNILPASLSIGDMGLITVVP